MLGHADDAFDFRAAKLGMSLSDFKQLPFPDAQSYTSRTGNAPAIICTGHPGLDSIEILLRSRGIEQSLGVVKCLWAIQGELKFNRTTYYAPAPINVAGTPSQQILYYFVKRPEDPESRLFRISISGMDTDHFERVAQGLKERFGPPAQLREETVQNRMGAKFSNTIMWWRNAYSSIYLIERSGTIDKMALTYRHDTLVEYVEKEKVKTEGKPSDKL